MDQYTWDNLVSMGDGEFDVVVRLTTTLKPEQIPGVVRAAQLQRHTKADDLADLEEVIKQARAVGARQALSTMGATMGEAMEREAGEDPGEAPDGA